MERRPRRATWIALTIGAAAFGGSVAGQAAPGTDHPITDPIWKTRPTGDQMSAAYPMEAMRAEKIGVAVVQCVAAEDGQLEACAVVCEGPKGWGFGKAALKTTRFYRLAAQDKSGQPVTGRAVKLPYHFNPPWLAAYDRCEPAQ